MSRNQSKSTSTETEGKRRRKENKPLCQLHLEIAREIRYQFHGAEYEWEDEKYRPFSPYIKYRIKVGINALAVQYGLDRDKLNMGELYDAAVRARRAETNGVSTQNLLIDRIIYHVLEHYKTRLGERPRAALTGSAPTTEASQPTEHPSTKQQRINELRYRLDHLDDRGEAITNSTERFRLEREIYDLEREADADDWTGFDVIDDEEVKGSDRPGLRLITEPAETTGGFVNVPPPAGYRNSDQLHAVEITDQRHAAAGIFPGDLTITYETTDVQNGDFGSVVQGKIIYTGRYYSAPGGYMRIEDDHETHVFQPGEASLLGRVVGVVRNDAYILTAFTFRPIR